MAEGQAEPCMLPGCRNHSVSRAPRRPRTTARKHGVPNLKDKSPVSHTLNFCTRESCLSAGCPSEHPHTTGSGAQSHVPAAGLATFLSGPC